MIIFGIFRNLFVIAAIAVASLFISASAFAADRTWTVLIYMNGKNNLEPYAIDNFQELAKIGSSERVKFVVQLGRPVTRSPKDPMRSSFGGWSGGKRFLVTAGMTPEAKNAIMDAASKPSEVDMGDPGQFEAFLRWGKTKYPADRYVVVIWNHGQGYRLMLTTDDAKAMSSAPKSLASMMAPTATYRSVSYDEDTRSILYNRDVRDRLSSAFKRSEVALVGFDACLMAMIETAYELSSTTPILVASEELEPGRGWNYAYLAEKLTANPNMSDGEFAQSLVDMYRDRYGDDDETTLSAIDLDRLPAAADAVSKVSDTLIADLRQFAPMIEAARSKVNPYNVSEMPVSIDLIRLLDLLEAELVKDGHNAVLLQKVRTAKQAAKQTVIANYASSLRQADWGSNGLAVYFPKTAEIYRRDPDGIGYLKGNQYKPISFVKDKTWADFLAAYYAR